MSEACDGRLKAEDAIVLDELRLQQELRWCRRLRSLLELMPDGFSLAIAGRHVVVSRTDAHGTVVMDRAPYVVAP